MAPVRLPGDRPAWVVTRHAEAQQVYTDARITTDSSTPGFPVIIPPPVDHDPRDALRQSFFIDMDPPEHDRLRRMLISEFSVRRVNQLRRRIQRLADGLVVVRTPHPDDDRWADVETALRLCPSRALSVLT